MPFFFFKSSKSQSWFFALYSGNAVDTESSKPLKQHYRTSLPPDLRQMTGLCPLFCQNGVSEIPKRHLNLSTLILQWVHLRTAERKHNMKLHIRIQKMT